MKQPRVGVGAIVQNERGEVLLGLRKNAHGEGTWAFGGGHLEMGESFADCARRETFEETGLLVESFRCVGVTNDFFDDDRHYVTVFMMGLRTTGEPEIKEPEKCADWRWFPWDRLPQPLFLTLENLLIKKDPENSLSVIGQLHLDNA